MFEELRAAVILKLMVAELTLLYLIVAWGGGGGGRGSYYKFWKKNLNLI